VEGIFGFEGGRQGGWSAMTKEKIVSFHIPEHMLDALDRLVEMGLFHSRSDAIRAAIFLLLSNHIPHYLEWVEKQKQVGYR
jgi:Arc/MetJ-type ribon-helix-helix transcriptional regulator